MTKFAEIKESVANASKHWQLELVEKYQNLRNTCNDNLSGLWDSLEFELAIQKILNIKDCTLPFAGIILGPPSSLKTVGIEMFRKWINTFYTDSFSAKSMVSHSTAVKKEELAKIDMLPKIKNMYIEFAFPSMLLVHPSNSSIFEHIVFWLFTSVYREIVRLVYFVPIS